jgi:hypothetical protein
MSGSIAQIGSVQPKRKRKAGRWPNWYSASPLCQCSADFAIHWCDIPRRGWPVEAESAKIRHFSQLARPMQPRVQYHQTGVTIMKTIAFLVAALILSATTLSATVAVPVGAAQITA